MKYLKIISLAIVVLILIGLVGGKTSVDQFSNEYLRIHIRANSNEDVDQSIKYEIKDKVVEFLTPYLINVYSKNDAMNVISNLLGEIENVCDSVLYKNGYHYLSNARLCEEDFPTRAYDNFVLDAGVYDALIINLGTGEGNNWWCVVYPPLCFVNKNDNSSQNIKYKSKLKEIIEEFFKR